MTERSRHSTVLVITLASVALVAALGAGAWYLFIREDAPPEVDLDSATEQLTSTTSPDTSTKGEPTTKPDGIDGSWVVDNESGEFDFDSATGSFAGFRVTEELANIGAAEAVGRTGEVSGEMTIEESELVATEITVDMSTLTSNQQRRDDRVQEALETTRFPEATFELTEPVELGDGAAGGEDVSVDATGRLTVHGITNEVTVKLDARLADGTAVVVGSIPIALADYGVEAPTAPMVLSVSDEATVEFQLLFVPASTPQRTEDAPAN